MTPLQHYQHLIAQDVITADDEQRQVVQRLELLHDALLAQETRSFWQRLFAKAQPIRGFYLWGGVGTGKTLMIDNFYNCLPFDAKLRMHFHNFIQYIHHELHALQGTKNPVTQIAKQIRETASVLVLDELIVNDITDAMLLAELFTALIEQQICLVFTTNIHPDGLYEKGLQRQRFLPAIELIKQQCDLYHLAIEHDYRRQHHATSPNYYTPITAKAMISMDERFSSLTSGKKIDIEPVTIHHRPVQIIKQSASVIWFDFIALCNIPRSSRDYIKLANQYHTLFISNLRQIQAHETNLARSFINLIDVMYDHRIRVIISADVPIDQLYPEGKLLFAFARTQSRLTEMQADVIHGDITPNP